MLLNTDASGTNTSTGSGPASSYAYDAFGNTLPGSTLPANADEGSLGWAGKYGKIAETTFLLKPIQMGARVYFSTLGRFAQIDPIEGGTPNSYVYVLDSVNGNDYSGMFSIGSILGFIAPFFNPSISKKMPATPIKSSGDRAMAAVGSLVVCGGLCAGSLLTTLRVAVPATPALQNAYGKGQAGLRAVNATQNTLRIPSLSRTANYRIPDILVQSGGRVTAIGEVKNVKYQSFTSQIKDFVLYAQENDIPFALKINGDAGISKTLQGSVNSGMIDLNRY